MNENEILEKVKKYKTWIKWGGGIALLYVIGPVLAAIAQSMAALIAIAVMVAVVAFAWEPFTEWLGVQRLKALSAVAQANPALVLWKGFHDDQRALEEQRQILEGHISDVETVRLEANKLDDYPEEKASYLERLEKMEAVVSFRLEKYNATRKTLAEAERAIRKAEVLYNADQSLIRLGKKINAKTSQAKAYIESEAFKAMQRASSQATASLRMTMNDDAFAKEQIAQRVQPLHAVSYDAEGRMITGNILQPIDVSVKVLKETS